MDKGYGVGYAILLWPSTGTWPTAGEIDFAEDGGGNRQATTATLHYGATDSKIQRNVNADFSQWHTLGVEWSPNKLVYTLDGTTWATVNSTAVPKGPMELDIQSQTGTCGDPNRPCPNASTPKRVNMQVDWVAAYAPS
jgi:beta-glucanase (GH16 family)